MALPLHVDDLYAPIPRSIFGIRLRPVARFGRANPIPFDARRVINSVLQNLGNTHRALAGEREVVVVAERLDRLIVSVTHDQHTAGDLTDSISHAS
jgi:hypothetical protein